MSTNGNANGHSNGAAEIERWKVGLINSEQKYLTLEAFGHKINASGTGLKKKQTWVIEQDPNEDVVKIKSHAGGYLKTDKYGNVNCKPDDEEEEEEQQAEKPVFCEKFSVEYAKDGSGKCALKSQTFGNYFGGKDDKLTCFSKAMGKSEMWIVQLATHPQVNVRNVVRKRYAILCEDEIHCTKIVPWGEACLIILHFNTGDGKYSFKTCDGRFLHRDGTLVDDLCEDTKFTLEIRSVPTVAMGRGLAFKDCKGYYLAPHGSTATLKSGKNKSVGKDELFALDDTSPQVTVSSQNNGKLISVRQGVDLSANQCEVCDDSTFQMEYDKDSQKWAFRTSVEQKYWTLESFGGIQAASKTKSKKSLFEVESNEDGTVCIKADNSKHLYNKQTGSILCNQENPDSKVFIIKMVNRPYIILKCDYGFVDLKSPTSAKPEILCNKAAYGVTFIEPQDDGLYYLKASNNKYWTLADDKSIMADSDTPTCKFLLEFRGQSRMSIRAPNGKYMKGEPNSFLAKGDTVDASTEWEY